MKQYLLSVYQPDGDPPPPEILDGIMRDVHAVNQAMKDAGVWVFTAGLHAASASTVVRAPAPGKQGQPLITDGPFAEGKEHIGGFTIIEAADLDVALEWARKLAQATTLPIEVRPIREGGHR
jgi:hypothetical protein